MAGLVIAAALLSACTPAPEPTPTASPAFASEEEAFAAAEETYRAYIAASNARIEGRTSPDPRDYLMGEALEADRSTQDLFAENAVHLDGEARLKSFKAKTASLDKTPSQVEAVICMDASGTRILDTDNRDVTPPTRPETSSVRVTLLWIDERFLIADSRLLSEAAC